MTEQQGGIPLLPHDDSVIAVVRQSGRSDAKDFLEKLEKRDQARFLRYIQYLAAGRPLKSPEHFRRLSAAGAEPPVYELKSNKYRLYVVRTSRRWYITHGREKPKNNQVPREVEKALAIFWDRKGNSP